MQNAVRDVGTVLDRLRRTRQLLENDDPRVKGLATQKLKLQTDADWEATTQKVLQQLDGSMQIAQWHATDTIKPGSPARAKPFVPAGTWKEILPAFPWGLP